MRFRLITTGAALLLVSCVTGLEFIDSRGMFRGTEGRVVIPANFLYSGSDALDDWLNEPYKLRFDEMSLRDVFTTHPLNSMRYRFEALPTDRPTFNMNSVAITRRQLLYALAESYDLEMSIDYEDQMPYAIVVRHNEHQPDKQFYLVE